MKRLDQFDIAIPCSARYFLEVCACVLLKVANKVPPKGKKKKKQWKLKFLGCFSVAKMEEGNLKAWIVLDQFGISIPFSATDFLEVDARISLKVATKVFPRSKKDSLDFSVVFV